MLTMVSMGGTVARIVVALTIEQSETALYHLHLLQILVVTQNPFYCVFTCSINSDALIIANSGCVDVPVVSFPFLSVETVCIIESTFLRYFVCVWHNLKSARR